MAELNKSKYDQHSDEVPPKKNFCQEFSVSGGKATTQDVLTEINHQWRILDGYHEWIKDREQNCEGWEKYLGQQQHQLKQQQVHLVQEKETLKQQQNQLIQERKLLKQQQIQLTKDKDSLEGYCKLLPLWCEQECSKRVKEIEAELKEKHQLNIQRLQHDHQANVEKLQQDYQAKVVHLLDECRTLVERFSVFVDTQHKQVESVEDLNFLTASDPAQWEIPHHAT